MGIRVYALGFRSRVLPLVIRPSSSSSAEAQEEAKNAANKCEATKARTRQATQKTTKTGKRHHDNNDAKQKPIPSENKTKSAQSTKHKNLALRDERGPPTEPLRPDALQIPQMRVKPHADQFLRPRSVNPFNGKTLKIKQNMLKPEPKPMESPRMHPFAAVHLWNCRG